MQYPTTILATLSSLFPLISAHGYLTSPTPRTPGDAFASSCGQQAFYNQASDIYGNIQGILQIASSQADFSASDCNVWLCKGFAFADNSANVQTWTAGQIVDFAFDLRAPHAGFANVSIVDTKTNKVIGEPLATWADFANNAYPTPANQTKFAVTIPADLGGRCATAGDCVVQHFWDSRSVDQSYESCVDFVVAGSGSGTAPVSSSAAAPVVVSSTVGSISSSTVAPVIVSTTSSTSAGIPTTLQTVVSSSTTAAATPSATPILDNEEDCDEEL